MRKQFLVLLLLCLICLFAASCKQNEAGNAQESVNSELDDIRTDGNSMADNTNTDADSPSDNPIDVDLTTLSSTMVYAEVYNIMIEPDKYVGKTIKGIGAYNAYYYEDMDKYFHYFIISDATGCCPQGLDFVWNGEHIYPDDYPEIGEDIEVTGVFIKGEIDGQPYYYLAVDDISS